MRIQRGTTYLDGEGREWTISHFGVHGAVGTSAHWPSWRERPFISHRLFDEHGRTIAGLGRNAALVSVVEPSALGVGSDDRNAA